MTEPPLSSGSDDLPDDPTSPDVDPVDPVDMAASARLDREPSRGADDPVPNDDSVDQQAVEDRREEFEAIAGALRDEPIRIEPGRREDVIAAALGTTVAADPPGDELAARRELGTVPAPSRATPRFARSGLVAAVVVLIAAVGLVAVFAGGSTITTGASDESAGQLDSSAADSTIADSATAGAGTGADGAERGSPADQLDEAPAAAAASPTTTTTPDASSSEALKSDARRAGAADLGTYASLADLLAVAATRTAPATEPGSTQRFDPIACEARYAGGALPVIGRAVVVARPVIIVASTDPPGLIVLDAVDCTELGRRPT